MFVEVWYRAFCPDCDTANWVYGHDSDEPMVDLGDGGFTCWRCHRCHGLDGEPAHQGYYDVGKKKP